MQTPPGNQTRQLAANVCPRCRAKPLEPRPVFKDANGEHICGDCWQHDREQEPEYPPMPWEM
jgi:hypothetical protein